MDYIATTISEHIFLQGKAVGKTEGEAKVRLEGQIELLKRLYLLEILMPSPEP